MNLSLDTIFGGGLVAKLYLTLATPWTVAHQAPLSMGFSSQEYWSGLPIPPPGDLPKPKIKPRSPVLQVDSLPSEPPVKPKTNTSMIHWPRIKPQSPMLEARILPLNESPMPP